ncbi:hypothetical protein TYRP_012845 [Tyrophagus putrescentiae]|nr:hypothetical protein TYRP_012845 [Tyrophagus putrescentiae]
MSSSPVPTPRYSLFEDEEEEEEGDRVLLDSSLEEAAGPREPARDCRELFDEVCQPGDQDDDASKAKQQTKSNNKQAKATAATKSSKPVATKAAKAATKTKATKRTKRKPKEKLSLVDAVHKAYLDAIASGQLPDFSTFDNEELCIVYESPSPPRPPPSKTKVKRKNNKRRPLPPPHIIGV